MEKLEIQDGEWEQFENSQQRRDQLKVNKISYSWDKLIEKFNHHILTKTQHYTFHSIDVGIDACIRFLARENRTRRRLLAMQIDELIRKTPPRMRGTRLLLPSRTGDPYYVFLLLPFDENVAYEIIRKVRREVLVALCQVVKYLNPNAQDVVGFATESGKKAGTSEDAVYFDARNWTEKDAEKAKYYHEKKGFLSNTSMAMGKISEYPKPNDGVYYYYPAPKPRPASRQAVRLEPKNPRNLLCRCGSGKKWKKCHGG